LPVRAGRPEILGEPLTHRCLADDLRLAGGLINDVLSEVGQQGINIVTVDRSDVGAVRRLLDRLAVRRGRGAMQSVTAAAMKIMRTFAAQLSITTPGC